MNGPMNGQVTILVVLFLAGTVFAGDAPCSETQVLASDGAASQWFGHSVSVRDGIAVVGAVGDDVNGPFSGSAYVYEFEGEAWLEQVKLVPADGAEFWNFGRSVSVWSEFVVVGAPGADELGAAYVFRRDGGTWPAEQKLTASDASLFSGFGGAVVVSGDVLAVGASNANSSVAESGAVYVFGYDGDAWSEDQKLWASDAAVSDLFGISVAIDGEWLLVGASRDDDNAEESGSAYVFRRNGLTWEEHQKLTAFDGAETDQFGGSVALSGDVAVVGASQNDDPVGAGAAYVFRWNGSTWDLEQKLTALDGDLGHDFGVSVSLEGATILVGAGLGDGVAADTGAAYLFQHDGASWIEEKLQASDGGAFDRFGQSVALTGDTFLVGAFGDDEQGQSSGSAYFFELDCGPPCPADVSGDDEVGVTDLTFVILAWGQTGGASDINQDGIVDVLDLVEVITSWGPCS
jgi:hypothetical protein